MKKFLIQFEDGENTRWLVNDAQVASIISSIANSVAIAHTTGRKPAVVVSVEEKPENALPCPTGP